MNPKLATFFQIVIGSLIVYLYCIFFFEISSVIIGTLIIIILFYKFDAFPYKELRPGKEEEGLIVFNKHIHHSFLGIIGVIIFFISYFFMPFLIFDINLVFFKLNIFNLGLWISIAFIISQLHEIIYNKRIFFQHRVFPPLFNKI